MWRVGLLSRALTSPGLSGSAHPSRHRARRRPPWRAVPHPSSNWSSSSDGVHCQRHPLLHRDDQRARQDGSHLEHAVERVHRNRQSVAGTGELRTVRARLRSDCRGTRTTCAARAASAALGLTAQSNRHAARIRFIAAAVPTLTVASASLHTATAASIPGVPAHNSTFAALSTFLSISSIERTQG